MGSETNKYFYNRLFMGRCFVHESKTRLSTREIDEIEPGPSMFLIFCLSKPIFKFADIELKEFSRIFRDMTDTNHLPRWMETDILYAFEFDKLKKDVKNKMIPYHEIVDLKHLLKVELVDSRHVAVRVSLGRLSHEDFVQLRPSEKELRRQTDESLVFFFENMIEGYKFYSYCKALVKNQNEFYNSLKYQIHYNLGRSDSQTCGA